MASVSSLDSDMRNLRLSKYTPAAANQVRGWIEDSLGEKLAPGDLLDALKDGTALCKLANLAIGPPGIKFKQSQMPFVQMENISHFLRACELSPLNMPSHDRFLTVDLYESKDPAQVLQCLSAFSRVANSLNSSRFPTTIGGTRNGALSPTGSGTPGRSGTPGTMRSARSMYSINPSTTTARPLSPTKTGGSATSSNHDATRSSGPVSSWSKKGDEGATAPAWNIHQYGYMGGASQGNQGVSFGGRRQIIAAAPQVPSLAEKERKRREKEAEEQRERQEAEEAEKRRRIEQEAEEGQRQAEEERRWEAETKRLRNEERQRLDEQKRQWEEQERRWKAEEDARLKEEAELNKGRPTGLLDGKLNGQYLSQYQAEQANSAPAQEEDTPESRRVKQLEKQLEEAKERERQYQLEREQRLRQDQSQSTIPNKRVDSMERPSSAKESEASWAPEEREVLRQGAFQRVNPGFEATRSVPAPTRAVREAAPIQAPEATPEPEENSTRPLPDPVEYQPRQQAPNRTEQFLSTNRPPAFQRPTAHQPAEMSSTLEEQSDRDRRIASQEKTKAGGWASKSLLEREMDRERERQKEWEANQEATKHAVRDPNQGSGPNQSWSTAQYGSMGGDNQNRGSGSGSGIAMGGRRQIIGPRPQPGAR